MYNVVNGQFIWAGAGPEPKVGESPAEYTARTSLAAPGIAAPTGQTVSGPMGPITLPGGTSMITTGLLPQQLGIQPQVTTPTLKAGDDPSIYARATALLPATVAGAAAAVVGGAAAATLGVAYGITQAAGLQYPWETGDGEGFIMPWTEMIRDEAGKWVTRKTRPDLFPGGQVAPTTGLLGMGAVGGVGMVGDPVVNTWTTTVARKDGTLVQTPFIQFASGKIAVQRANGTIKVYRPKKHIILPRGTTTLSQAVKAQRYLDRMWRTVAKRTKALKMA